MAHEIKLTSPIPPKACERLTFGMSSQLDDVLVFSVARLWCDAMPTPSPMVVDTTGFLTGTRHKRVAVPHDRPDFMVALACDGSCWRQVETILAEGARDAGLETAVEALLAGVPASDLGA